MAATTDDAMVEAFEKVLVCLRDPILVVSRSGRIVTANVAAAEALGTNATALAGTSIDAYAIDQVGDRIDSVSRGEASLQLRARDGRRFTCDTRTITADLFLVELSGSPDVATQTRAFFDLYWAAPRITETAAPALDELSRALLALGMSSVGALSGGVFVIDEAGTTLELVGHIGYRDAYTDRFRLIPLDAPLPICDVVRTTAPLFLLTAAEQEARYPELVKAHAPINAVAMACIPLAFDGRCIGGIALALPLGVRLGDPERASLAQLGEQCARTVVNARERDRAAPARVASLLERLNAFSSALARAITPGEAITAAVDAGIAATGARAGGLWRRSHDGKHLQLVRALGPTGPQPESNVRVLLDRPSRMPILDAVRDGTPVWIESCAQLEERYPESYREFSRGGEVALACLPLHAGGRCIGGVVYVFAGMHRFVDDERSFFEALAWYAAQSLERAELYAVERRARGLAEANERRSAFRADSDAVLGSLDYRTTVAAIAATAVPRIADWCIVELEDDRVRGLPATCLHADPSKIQHVLELSRRLRKESNGAHGIAKVIETGRAILYASITAEAIREHLAPELAELYVATGLVSSMTVPISAHGRTLGAILLNSANPDRVYDDGDLAMAEELGRKVGLALENARLYRDVREADRVKDEFLAMLSHELRNPLAAIVAAIELLKLQRVDELADECDLIERNTRRLVRITDDLLDLSRITRGKVKLNRLRHEIAELVDDAIDIAYPLVEDRGHRLQIAVPPHGLAVHVDRVRLAQVIANVVTNAAKYTPRGGTIDVTAFAEAGDAIVRVRDTGIGIAPDMLPRIFDLFVQAEGTFERAPGGLGIGLTVVKSIVDLHGGTVVARSDGLGHGAELEIRLPLDASDALAVAAAPDGELVVTPKRVLVVDDNADAAAMLGALLVAIGCTMRIAHDGASALRIARELAPDLALVDLLMPEMDGFELAHQLRELSASLRLVAVTGYGQDADRARSREAGFADHVVKPVDLATLRRIVG